MNKDGKRKVLFSIMSAAVAVMLAGCNVNSAYDEWKAEQDAKKKELENSDKKTSLRNKVIGIYRGTMDGYPAKILISSTDRMQIAATKFAAGDGSLVFGYDSGDNLSVVADGQVYASENNTTKFLEIIKGMELVLSYNEEADSLENSSGTVSVKKEAAQGSVTGAYYDAGTGISFTVTSDGLLDGKAKLDEETECDYSAKLTEDKSGVYIVSEMTEKCGDNTISASGLAAFFASTGTLTIVADNGVRAIMIDAKRR